MCARPFRRGAPSRTHLRPPRTGQEGILVVSVNTSRVGVEIYRSATAASRPRSVRTIRPQLSGYSARQIANEKGVRIWSGASTPPRISTRTWSPPSRSSAVGTLQPGVYDDGAPQNGGAPTDDEDYETRATQWFIVSDLGLTALKGADGVHVLVRSLASAEPVRSVEIDSSPATTRSSRRRRRTSWAMPPSIPALPAAKAVLRRVVVATAGTDYGFLDLDSPPST